MAAKLGSGFEHQFEHHIVKNVKTGVPRIWVDGCFDMFHWGHANVIRQAAAAFDYKCCLCVGLHSDKTITSSFVALLFCCENNLILSIESIDFLYPSQ